MSSDDVNTLKQTINEVINGKKRNGTWGPHGWQTTLALIAALRLPDSSVADYLESQGAELSTRSLLSVVQKGSAKLLRFVIKELQKIGKWWPDDWYTGLALAEAWFFERKKIYAVFSEHDVVFMPEWLVTAVKYGDIGLIVKIIHGLKATYRWDPSDTFILQAITEAIKEDANIWYYCLLQEGAVPNFQHLVTAVRRGDCNILKDIIQNLKRQGVWEGIDRNKDIKAALEEACIKKDITAYSTLTDEGAEPTLHCFLTAVKSDYYQLASKISRDLKLSGKWNEKVLKNDWSLVLAEDYISQLPEGIRQTWENLLYSSITTKTHKKDLRAQQEIVKISVEDSTAGPNAQISEEVSNEEITNAPPNTPIERPYVLPTGEMARFLAHEEEVVDADGEMYDYDEPSDETLYRCLQRSISAPVATNEYEHIDKTVKAPSPGRKRYSTGNGQRLPSDPTLLSPRIDSDNADKQIMSEGSSLNIASNARVDIRQEKENEVETVDKQYDRTQIQDKQYTDDVLLLKRVPEAHVTADYQTQENRGEVKTAPCRLPKSPEFYLPRSSYRSMTSSSRYFRRATYSRSLDDPEILRLHRQFSFSIRSIPLTFNYGEHLRYLSSLRF